MGSLVLCLQITSSETTLGPQPVWTFWLPYSGPISLPETLASVHCEGR